jgi:hypothetical protein
MKKKLLMLVLAFVPAFSAAVEEAGLLETEEKIVENEATEFFTEQNTLIIEKVAETVSAWAFCSGCSMHCLTFPCLYHIP